MKVVVFSSAELCKHVSAVVPAGVSGFVCPVGLDLPEEQEVPLLTHGMEDLVAPEYKGFVRGWGGRRVREVDCIQGVRAVRADLVAEGGRWWLELYPGEGFTYGGEFTRVVAAVGRSMVLGVQGITVNPVVLFMEGADGGSFQGEVPPPSQVR